jgi:hypothetical protein
MAERSAEFDVNPWGRLGIASIAASNDLTSSANST